MSIRIYEHFEDDINKYNLKNIRLRCTVIYWKTALLQKNIRTRSTIITIRLTTVDMKNVVQYLFSCVEALKCQMDRPPKRQATSQTPNAGGTST